MKRLTGKVAIVSGGSRGMGEATVRLFIEHGAKVVIGDILEDEGKALAQELDCAFYDGDDYHPPENIAKMAKGLPLNDDDRYPWLALLHNLIEGHLDRGETAIVACSALKKKYRDQLRAGTSQHPLVQSLLARLR